MSGCHWCNQAHIQKIQLKNTAIAITIFAIEALSLLSPPVTRAPNTPTISATAMSPYMIVPVIIGAGISMIFTNITSVFNFLLLAGRLGFFLPVEVLNVV